MRMQFRWITLGLLAALFTAAACDDYLTGPGVTTDPNRPGEATVDQLINATQIRMFSLHEGHIPRVTGMWIQHFAGTDRQYLEIDNYVITEADFTTEFSDVYTGGGLIDLRRIQEQAGAAGDRMFVGMAKVIEAFNMGMAASVWGDIPYSEAVNDEVLAPALDDQAEVYSQVQDLLDEAIQDLESGEGREPAAQDLVHGGDMDAWVEAAHTLKARFHLHWAGIEPGRYQQAYDAAQNGISSPGNDFTANHTATAGEENVWFQFITRERDTYMRAGAFLVNLLQERGDPRLQEYFSPGENGEYSGARPATSDLGASLLSPQRLSPAFNQPLITWAENQLIMAEAAARGAGGGEGEAQTLLNEVREEFGLGPVSAGGDALLEEILTEKYIATFQTTEAWNDYKRTCFPEIEPIAGRRVPGRLYYGEDERNVNPNIPPPAQQAQRNPNDPGECTAETIGGS